MEVSEVRGTEEEAGALASEESAGERAFPCISMTGR